jgi:hypothetical protein
MADKPDVGVLIICAWSEGFYMAIRLANLALAMAGGLMAGSPLFHAARLAQAKGQLIR